MDPTKRSRAMALPMAVGVVAGWLLLFNSRLALLQVKNSYLYRDLKLSPAMVVSNSINNYISFDFQNDTLRMSGEEQMDTKTFQESMAISPATNPGPSADPTTSPTPVQPVTQVPTSGPTRSPTSTPATEPRQSTNTTPNPNVHPFTAMLFPMNKTDQNIHQSKLLIYNVGKPMGKPPGFGSIVNHMLYVASSLRLQQGRQLVLDESDAPNYRKDSTHGMVSGYFDTSFPVIRTKNEYQQIQQETRVDMANLTLYKRNTRVQRFDHLPILNVVTHDYSQPRTTNTWKQATGDAVTSFYNQIGEKNFQSDATSLRSRLQQFYLLSLEVCHHLTINSATEQAIQGLLKQASIPDFAALASNDKEVPGRAQNNSRYDAPIITVTIHVRRTDKIREAQPTPAIAYARKLEQILHDNNLTTPQQLSAVHHCFVATDDYQAFLEVQKAFASSSTVSHCRLHALAAPTKKGGPTTRDGDGFTLLLAEMKMMVDATLFIGTFTSNVGTLAALFRGCKHHQAKVLPLPEEYNSGLLSEAQISNKLDHYFHSYGLPSPWVKTNDWFVHM